MKTNLKITINTSAEAISFITELCKNDEIYHPEDDAFDIVWKTFEPTDAEKKQLNDLMNQIYKNTDVDPCEIALNFINN